jgi:NADPH-dependent curcumin reductase
MIPLGEVMRAFGVVQVIETRFPEFKKGDLVQGMFGWLGYVATDTQAPGGLRKLAPQVPPNVALSLFGI